MASKPLRPMRVAALQELKVEPITAPDELAALEHEVQKNRERNDSPVRVRGVVWHGVPPAPFLEPATDHLAVIEELVTQLSVEEKCQLIERLVAELPRETGEQFRTRLAGCERNG